MRDKFKDLIDKGIASFNYTPLTSNVPDTDPICRFYNNVFSIPTDTHMSITAEGERVITGHMINTDKWEKFCCSPYWGAVVFKTAGVWSFCDFLYRNNLVGVKSSLNGDVVYKVVEKEDNAPEVAEGVSPVVCPASYHTLGSQIPQPINTLTNSGNRMHLIECFDNDLNVTVKRMNESTWVKGCNWVAFEDKIVGLLNESVVIIKVK